MCAMVAAVVSSCQPSADTATSCADGFIRVDDHCFGFRPIANMPTNVDQGALLALPDGRLMLAGGATSTDPNGDPQATSATHIYNPDDDVWTPGPSLVTGRAAAAVTTLIDGRIMLVGGDQLDRALSTTEIFDPATETFLSGPSLQTGRQFHGAFTARDGTVIAVAGFTGINGSNEFLDSNEILAPGANRFSVDPCAQGTFVDGGAVGDNVVVVGGEGGVLLLRPPSYTCALDFDEAAFAPRASAAARLTNGDLLTAGGLFQGERDHVARRYHATDDGNVEATIEAPLPSPGRGKLAPLDGDSALFLGGCDSDTGGGVGCAFVYRSGEWLAAVVPDSPTSQTFGFDLVATTAGVFALGACSGPPGDCPRDAWRFVEENRR